jgi:uncharacterized protein
MLSAATGNRRGMQSKGSSIGTTARLLLLFVLLAISPAAFAFSAPERTGWVTDEAGILDSDTAAALAATLSDLQRKTGDEVVVVTLKSLQGASIETWGNVLGESWGIGRSNGHDTGALLIVAPNDRKVRIAVGYGLGNRISDAIADAIITDHILPYFRQGDFVQGVKSGVGSIVLQLDRASGTTTVPSSTDVERGAYPVKFQQPSFWQWLRWKLTPSHHTKVIAFWVAVVVIVLVLMMMTNFGGGRRRYYDDDGWGSSSSGGGWSSSSGGGSSSSGGGSSSSGGGSFGGGATGSW